MGENAIESYVNDLYINFGTACRIADDRKISPAPSSPPFFFLARVAPLRFETSTKITR